MGFQYLVEANLPLRNRLPVTPGAGQVMLDGRPIFLTGFTKGRSQADQALDPAFGRAVGGAPNGFPGFMGFPGVPMQ